MRHRPDDFEDSVSVSQLVGLDIRVGQGSPQIPHGVLVAQIRHDVRARSRSHRSHRSYRSCQYPYGTDMDGSLEVYSIKPHPRKAFRRKTMNAPQTYTQMSPRLVVSLKTLSFNSKFKHHHDSVVDIRYFRISSSAHCARLYCGLAAAGGTTRWPHGAWIHPGQLKIRLFNLELSATCHLTNLTI